MKIHPQKTLKISYKASFYMNDNPSPSYLFYDRKTGQITLFDFNFNPIGTANTGFEIKYPCSVHPEKAYFAVINEKQALYIFDFSGNKIKEIAGDYWCAAFNANGDLWAFERMGHEQLRWVVYNAGWEPVATLDMEDSLYDSHLFLTAVPASSDMIMELASGQDGSAIYLLTNNGGNLSVKEMFPNQCLSRPAFSEDGTRFLTLEFYDGILYHYTYPQLEKLGTYNYEESEDFQMDGTVLYIDPATAVISYNSRYFLLGIDNKEMKLGEEILIEGHEPEPTEKFYPRLSGDKSLMTDITYMKAMGQKILADVDFNPEKTVLVFDRTDFTKS